MAVPRWLRASCAGSVAVLLLLLAPFPLLGPAAAHGGGSGAPVGEPCPGGAIGTAYSGTLSFEGGPLPVGDLDNVSIQYSYAYQTTVVNGTGQTVSVSCTTVVQTVLTGPDGAFSVTLTLPLNSCDRETGDCEVISGPFGPLSAGPTLAAPAGYGTVATVYASSIAIDFVADLASLTLDPVGPVAAYSPSGVETVSAQPLTGDGAGTPGTPQYDWSLTGTGWRFLGPLTGSAVNLTGAPGAGPGTLSVQARLTVGNTTFTAGPTNLSLEVVPTSLLAASENQSEIDAGEAVSVTLTAAGAPGYAYTAVALPGLGLSARPLACSSEPNGATSELVACSTNLTYPDPGVGTPEVVVTNGYSTASENLAPVTVNPPPALEVVPASPLAYAGQPASIRLAALPGTGTAPYRGACLDPGDGPVLCQMTAGPSWSFAPEYATAGTYVGAAWTWDARGVNSSLPVTVTVASPLALGSIAGASVPVPEGEPTSFSANLTGGFLPGRYWWNVSSAPGPVATGTVPNDGPLAVTWVATLPGSVFLSLTVVDAVGTSVERSVVVSVGAEPAQFVSAIQLPPADLVMAGTSIGVTWEAFDGAGTPALTFAPAALLSLTESDGSAPSIAWANASGAGPLPVVASGVFGIPSAAWVLGRLNLSVATVVAGPLTLRLASLGGLASPPPLTVYVGPDLTHLHLYDPEVVLPGDRTNRTLWHIEDEFGNPTTGTSVEVEFSTVGFSEDTVMPVLAEAGGTTGVWVNFSAPTSAGGTVEVRSPLSGVLLGPLQVPAATSGASGRTSWNPLVLGVPIGAAALGAAAVVARRRRAASRSDLSEEELQHFVEGRDRVIAAVEAAGVADLARIEAAWTGTAPPAELSDWVASLVADGTLGARTGPDGVARFCLAAPALGPAHIVLDEEALAEATRARDALVREPERERPEEPR